MKIGFDGRSLAANGLRGWDRYTIALIKELELAGHHIVLFYDRKNPLCSDHLASLKCSLYPISSPSGLFWEQILLPFHIWWSGCQIYHAPCERGIPFFGHCPRLITIHSVTYHSYIDLIQRNILSPPLSRYIGKDFDPSKPSWSDRYILAQFKNATHIFAPSEFTKSEIINFLDIPNEKITVTHLSISEEFSRPPSSEEDRSKTLNKLGISKQYSLFISGFEAHKNLNGLVKTFAGIRESIPEMKFVLVGTGKVPDSLASLLTANNFHPNEDCFCFVDLKDELVDLYDEAEIYINLSWRESFGLPALEATSRGLPVVISKYGASKEIFRNQQILVDPNDVDSVVTESINAIKNDSPEKRIERKSILDRFSWKKMAKITENVYKKFLES